MGLIGSEVPESGKTVTLRAGLMNGASVTWVEVPVTVFPAEETSGETFTAFLGKLAEKNTSIPVGRWRRKRWTDLSGDRGSAVPVSEGKE